MSTSKKSLKLPTPKTIIDPDERIPFTCQVTNEYVGASIKSVFITVDDKVISIIPVSSAISEKINHRFGNKVSKFIIQELQK